MMGGWWDDRETEFQDSHFSLLCAQASAPIAHTCVSGANKSTRFMSRDSTEPSPYNDKISSVQRATQRAFACQKKTLLKSNKLRMLVTANHKPNNMFALACTGITPERKPRIDANKNV